MHPSIFRFRSSLAFVSLLLVDSIMTLLLKQVPPVEAILVTNTQKLHKHPTHAKSHRKVSNKSSSKPLVLVSDDQVVVYSTIPEGFAIVENESFEGKRIIATKSFSRGSVAYTGYAQMRDLSTTNHGFTLRLYSEDRNGRRKFLHEYQNNDTHSVDDYGVGSKGDTNKRQVYGW